MTVKVEDIATPKLAHWLAWRVRQAEVRDDDTVYAGRVQGFEEAVGLMLGLAPELVSQILALPEFRAWWRDEEAPEELLAEALNKLVSLKRPAPDQEARS